MRGQDGTSNSESMNHGAVAPPKKFSSFSKFKRKLMPSKSKSSDQAAQPSGKRFKSSIC